MKKLFAVLLALALVVTTLTMPALAKTKTVKTTKVTLSETGTVTLEKGKTLQLTATLRPKNSTQPVKWSTSNKKVATVSSKGKVTAKKAGTATITATSGKKSAKVKVKVVETSQKLPASLLNTWLYEWSTHNDGGAYRFKANGRYEYVEYEASGIGWYSVTYSGKYTVRKQSKGVYKVTLAKGKKTKYDGEGEYETDTLPATRKGESVWAVAKGGNTKGLTGTVIGPGA